jgi:hypothetical protein
MAREQRQLTLRFDAEALLFIENLILPVAMPMKSSVAGSRMPMRFASLIR